MTGIAAADRMSTDQMLSSGEGIALPSSASGAISVRRLSTTTVVPVGTRLCRSMMSWLNIRMQPLETDWPIDHGSEVPWMRYSVSRLP